MKLLKILCFILLCFFTHYVSAEVVVIVNINNSAALTKKEISKIFLKKLKTYPNKKKVIAINLPQNNTTRNAFEAAVLNKTSSQVKAYWAKLLFSGKGNPPKELSTEKEVMAFIANNINAIAYIDSANIDESVKVLEVF